MAEFALEHAGRRAAWKALTSAALVAVFSAMASCNPAVERITTFPDGSPWTRIQLRNGQLHGQTETWYASGSPRSAAQFYRGRPEGEWSTWHANGQLEATGSHRLGSPDGPWNVYSPAGTLVVSETFVAGLREGLRVFRSPGGQLLALENQRNGKREGIRLQFNSTEQVIQEDHFLEDVADGRLRRWDDEGHLIEVVNMSGGLQDGPHILFWPGGQKLAQGQLTRGVRVGPWFVWTKEGVLGQLSGVYAEGERTEALGAQDLAREQAVLQDRILANHAAPLLPEGIELQRSSER